MRRYLATPVQFIENTDLPRLRQGSVFSGGVSQLGASQFDMSQFGVARQWGTDQRRGRVPGRCAPTKLSSR